MIHLAEKLNEKRRYSLIPRTRPSRLRHALCSYVDPAEGDTDQAGSCSLRISEGLSRNKQREEDKCCDSDAADDLWPSVSDR